MKKKPVDINVNLTTTQLRVGLFVYATACYVVWRKISKRN